MRKLRPHLKTTCLGPLQLTHFADIAKLSGIRESTESVDRRTLVCRFSSNIRRVLGALKTGIFGPAEKVICQCTTRKGRILKMAKFGVTLRECGATTIRGERGQTVMAGCQVNEDVLCTRWRFHPFLSEILAF